MRNYETVDFILHVGSDYLEGIKKVVVTIADNESVKITYKNDNLQVSKSEGTISFSMTQKESAALENYNPYRLQVNILYNDGQRIVSKPSKIYFKNTDFSEVM